MLICIYFNPPRSCALISKLKPQAKPQYCLISEVHISSPNREWYRLSASLLPFRSVHLLPFPQFSRKGFKPNSCLPHQTPTARAYKGKPSGTSSSGEAKQHHQQRQAWVWSTACWVLIQHLPSSVMAHLLSSPSDARVGNDTASTALPVPLNTNLQLDKQLLSASYQQVPGS